MHRTARPTGAIGIKLDKEILLTAAREVFTALHPDADAGQLSHGPLPQMLIAVDRGNGAVVNGEGVGSIANEDGSVDVHFSYGFTWLPIGLALDQINKAATDKRIDLAEGIRTFGARLDANHRQWFRRCDADNSAQ
ncbi:hypothetical protein GCM10009715_42010 [Paeniglutamicibacter psychrophenolicus]|uniref:Uncharacterized protein n=1 Tax=Paeniglutamicibacter psychrophenolicus TaxID=257454 RepID=A0ABS4WJS7_9MICC|nr:hypothetical protein [Paeniglutamicibacter psychrophenolicus]MBP2376461.1 hypothetical protein [Paeniglutamicibacter psychrophenolicus]